MIAGTLCRCGHLLDCCADCRAWLILHSPRIAFHIEWWYIRTLEAGITVHFQSEADMAERDDLAYFISWRYSRND